MGKGIGPVQASAALIAGILIGQWLHPSLILCLVMFVSCLGGGIFFYRRGRQFVLDQPPKRAGRILLCTALLAFGMGRTALTAKERPAGMIETYVGGDPIRFVGTVIAPPTVSSSRTTLRVSIETSQPDPDSPSGGKVLLVFFRKPETAFHYGDRLQISGSVILPADSGSGFSYRSYLERSGITAMINNPEVEVLPGFDGSSVLGGIFRLRESLLERVYKLFPQPENALMAGILLGDESKISSEIDRDFQKTSTSHVIAISGANFTLLTWVLLSILRRLVPKWWAPLFMIPFIIFYTILVGANSAVTRAAVMCALSILGSVIGRTRNGINNLALTSALMTLVKPAYLYDLGFQLSVTATLGILLFSEPLCAALTRLLAKILPKAEEEQIENIVSILNDLCLMSISAQILTVWVSAQAFGQISLISLPANFLIAPFQPMIMLGGFLALGLSFIFYPLGAAAAWMVWLAPALTIRIVSACARIPNGSIYMDLPPLQAWLIIGLILLVYLCRDWLILSIRRRNYRPYAAMLLVFSAVMLWVNVLDHLNRNTEIEFKQTQSSMTMTIRSPQGRILAIADGLTNYAAQEILEKQALPVRRVTEAAWLEIPEEWMAREFLKSGAGEDLKLLYLNGVSRTEDPDIPQQMEAGAAFTVDGLTLRLVMTFLNRRAWIVETEGYSLLFPNGIPPERFRSGEAVDLIILGRKDSRADWQYYLAENRMEPALLDRTVSNRETFLRVGAKGVEFR